MNRLFMMLRMGNTKPSQSPTLDALASPSTDCADIVAFLDAYTEADRIIAALPRKVSK
jgi:hypothetical protein